MTIDSHTPILIAAAAGKFANEYAYLRDLLRHYLGHVATPAEHDKGLTAITLQDDPNLPTPESYKLSIANNRITLTAHSPAGMFYAIQTLRQLMPARP